MKSFIGIVVMLAVLSFIALRFIGMQATYSVVSEGNSEEFREGGAQWGNRMAKAFSYYVQAENLVQKGDQIFFNQSLASVKFLVAQYEGMEITHKNVLSIVVANYSTTSSQGSGKEFIKNVQRHIANGIREEQACILAMQDLSEANNRLPSPDYVLSLWLRDRLYNRTFGYPTQKEIAWAHKNGKRVARNATRLDIFMNVIFNISSYSEIRNSVKNIALQMKE